MISETLDKINIIDSLFKSLGITPEEYLKTVSTNVQPAPQQKEFVSRKEAAQILCCSVDTIDNLAAEGKIEKFKLSKARCGRVLIKYKSLMAYLQKHCAIKNMPKISYVAKRNNCHEY